MLQEELHIWNNPATFHVEQGARQQPDEFHTDHKSVVTSRTRMKLNTNTNITSFTLLNDSARLFKQGTRLVVLVPLMMMMMRKLRKQSSRSIILLHQLPRQTSLSSSFEQIRKYSSFSFSEISIFYK